MDREDINRLIETYVSGEGAHEQEQKLMEWYNSGPTDAVKWTSDNWLEEKEVKDRIYNNVESEIKRFERRRFIIRGLKIAASITGLLLGCYLLSLTLGPPASKQVSVSSSAGEVKYVVLADGSEIWLNAGSVIRYSEPFLDNRTVDLQGEAFFEVKHDEQNLFKVRTKSVTTTDFGTAFTIRSLDNSDRVVVTLESGKIAVGNEGQSFGFLYPGQELTVEESTGKATRRFSGQGKSFSWKNGKLDFDDLTLGEITERLSQWYGIKFVFKEEGIRKRVYNASFDNTVSLHDLLTLLCGVNKLSFSINGDTALLGENNINVH